MVKSIAMITPWNVRCGVATYSKYLVDALAEEDVEVYVARLPRFGIKTRELIIDVAERIPYDKVDIIHCQHEYGLYQNLELPFYSTLRRYGKPIITTMHSVGRFETDVIIGKISSKCIVHNLHCSKLFNLPATIIPHGVPPVRMLDRAQAKKMLGIDPKIPIVGYLGFISAYKGLETLITAMSKVKTPAGLLIAGGWHVGDETDYINTLHQLGDKMLGKKVNWIGFVPEEKLLATYSAMDVFVYPARLATESGAILQAMSYGKAILANDLPPYKEKEKVGALTTYNKTPESLALMIDELLNNKQLCDKLEKGAVDYAEKNSWSNIAKQHIKLYDSLMEKNGEN